MRCVYRKSCLLCHIITAGDYIDVIHEKWWGDYQLLEYNHSYIQWLFPIREQGLNMHAEVLQLHEAKVSAITV